MPEGNKQPLDPNEPVVKIRKPGEPGLTLSLNEYRLALIGLVDYDGQWPSLELATGFVVDGAAKADLLHGRLLPNASRLDALLARGVDGLELLAARQWFRTGEV